jgi:hypothetical protein
VKLAEAPQLENWKKLMEVSTKNILSLFTDRICDRKSLSIIFIGQYLPIKFDRKKTEGEWNCKINSI